jgi:hypothetical protein
MMAVQKYHPGPEPAGMQGLSADLMIYDAMTNMTSPPHPSLYPEVLDYGDWRFMAPLGESPAKIEIVMTYADGVQEVITFTGGRAGPMDFEQSSYHMQVGLPVAGYSWPAMEKRDGKSEECVLPTGCLMACHVKEEKDGE